MKQLEKIKEILDTLKQDTITPKEIESFLKFVLETIKNEKSTIIELTEKQKEILEGYVVDIENKLVSLDGWVDEKIENTRIDFTTEIESVKNLLKEIRKIKLTPGKDGVDGKDGRDGVDGYTPVKGIDYRDGIDGYTPIRGVDYNDGRDGSPDTGEQIVEKINNLEIDEQYQIDASHIKNLPKQIQNNIGGVIARNIYQMGDVALSGLTDGQVLTWDGTNNRWNNETPAATGIDGTMVLNRIPYGLDADTLQTSANLTFDGSLETLTADGLGTSQVSTKGIRLINNTAATALAPTQITPPIIFKSYAWRTDTSASQYGEIRMYSKPITGSGAIPPRLIIEGSRNGAAFADMLRIWDNGNIDLVLAIIANGTVGTDGQVLISKAGAANQWSSTIPWSFVSASAPTTLSGYGITDALVSSQGAYTPTLTNIANVASSTMRPTQWVKVGKTVHLYGTFEITPSSATTKTEFTIDIPVASTNGFANIYEAGGTANALHPDDEAGGVPMPVTIWADNGTWTNTQSIYMKYSAVSSSNAVFSFHLSYTIEPSAE